MKVSTKGRYALRMMIDIVIHGSGGCVSLKDISKRQEISVKYLEQIVGSLCTAGLLSSVRGPQGGYKLTRCPEKYTVGDIIRATEGSLAPVACLENMENQCPRAEECLSLSFWRGLNNVVNKYMDSVTLKSLADNHCVQRTDYSI